MKVHPPSDHERHFYNRIAFGVPPDGIINKDDFRSASRKVNPLNIIEKPVPGQPDVKAAFVKSRQDMIKLNTAWMSQLATTDTVLRERMTLLWHDHFACRTLVPWLAQQQNNTIRETSLGTFRDLLMGVSKDPAMLAFLNNQQNKKGKPNENFAREVMELFTLGRGHYSEKDIKEAARSFTGWGFNREAGFQFRPKQHDSDIKTFRGKTGNFTGEDIIEMLLDDRQTANFIVEKIYRSWVSRDDVDKGIVESLAESFYKSSYNIGKLVSSITDSDWFYDSRFVGNNIKSPVELILSIQCHTGGTFQNPGQVIFLQRAMGQLLFFPPNVGGWPEGREWIDSSSLLFRLSLPHLLLDQKESDFEAKDDGDMNSVSNTKGKQILSLHVDWEGLANRFTRGTTTETLDLLEQFLLPRPTTQNNRQAIAHSIRQAPESTVIQKLFIGFMSLPEFQLC